MGKMVSTIKGVRKDAYFEALLKDCGSTEETLERLRTEVRFAGVLNTCIPRGNLARKTATPAKATESRTNPTPDIAAASKSATAPDKPFDPFAIHTINVYKKEGADGLMNALSAIGDAAHLKSIVTAQRIPVAGLDDMDDAETLRASIVAAVAERIADRKAAAS